MVPDQIMTQAAIAAGFTVALEHIKRAPWAAWIGEHAPMVSRTLSAVFAALVSAGFLFSWSGDPQAGWTGQVFVPPLAAFADFFQTFMLQWGGQKLAYKGFYGIRGKDHAAAMLAEADPDPLNPPEALITRWPRPESNRRERLREALEPRQAKRTKGPYPPARRPAPSAPSGDASEDSPIKTFFESLDLADEATRAQMLAENIPPGWNIESTPYRPSEVDSPAQELTETAPAGTS